MVTIWAVVGSAVDFLKMLALHLVSLLVSWLTLTRGAVNAFMHQNWAKALLFPIIPGDKGLCDSFALSTSAHG